MARWPKGAGQVESLLEHGELERVSGGAEAARTLLDSARQHAVSARACAERDPEGAYALAYDSARKAGTALLAHQGLRPTTQGGHIAVVDAVAAQFPGVPGLKSLDRLRRRRNEAEYPDAARYDPIIVDEAEEAIDVAMAAVDAGDRLVQRPEIGLFR